ncbi:MAG TPA: ATP-binding protein [Patescibacteria group bacterium]|nr:ATP-binding protein [Patescibacteria group bacterium]
MPQDTAPVPQNDAQIERERLISLINSMADGVIAINEAKVVVIYNGAALNILDVNSTITGMPIDKAIKLVDKNNQPVNVVELINQTTRAYSTRDLLIQYTGGGTINLYLSIAPVHLGFGKSGAHGHVLLLRDITREKSLEEERDEFISVASHELRTPIAIAEGNISNAQMITDKGGDIEQVKSALKQAYDQITFLSGLINDLATLSRAERGKLTADVEDINAHQLLDDLAANYKPQAESKHLQLLTEIDPMLEVLKSNGLYVREMLQNFITNAIKYTETGSITIGARTQDKGIMFWVRDTGIGISKSDQDKVFDKFFRSEDFRTRQSKGTGLGLYVTMKLARLLHAEIDLHSELNKGSTFQIYVPNLS